MMHTSEHTIWVAPRGCAARKDYVAISKVLVPGVKASFVEGEVYLAIRRGDHLPVALVLSFITSFHDTSMRTSSFKCDRPAIANPALRSVIKYFLDRIPLVPWEADPHIHASIVTKQIQDVPSWRCPPNKLSSQRSRGSLLSLGIRSRRSLLSTRG